MWVVALRIPHQAASWDQRRDVGTHRWSHSLWISKWTLNWTQCPRIPHSTRLGAEFRFELLLVRVTGPPLLSHSTPTTSSTLDLQRAPLHLPPRGCLPSRSLLLGPTSCGELQAALAAGPKDCSSTAATQGPTNLRIWGTPSRLAPSCYPYKRKKWPVSSRDVTVTGVMVNHGKFPDGEGYR